MAAITEHESEQIERGERVRARRPSSSSTGCGCCRAAGTAGATVFEEAGYATLAPGWPDDPETVDEANAAPRGLRRQVDRRRRRPLRRRDRQADARSRRSIGHSFGGLLTQILAGRGPVGGVGRHRSRAVPRRAAAADLGAAVGVAGARATRSTTAVRFRSPTSSSATRSPTRSARTRRSELYDTYAVPGAG